MGQDLFAIAAELRRQGEPFALATVVRCERPTSAKPGAKALIKGDGTVLGWIGGACAEPVVVREALAALGDGQPRLLSLVGEAPRGPGRTEGMVEYAMACQSGGTLEIYVEPFLPSPPLVLVGKGPVVEALARLGAATDFGVEIVGPDTATRDELSRIALTASSSVVVATHGSFDEVALEWALGSDAGYVSLVASRKRSGVPIESLRQRGVAPDRLGRLKAPAGLDIGAVTPAEIAVSILAEIVQFRHAQKAASAAPTARAKDVDAEAQDPVCGMRVPIATARYRSTASAGRDVYFCCLGCKETFDRDPGRYVLPSGGGRV